MSGWLNQLWWAIALLYTLTIGGCWWLSEAQPEGIADAKADALARRVAHVTGQQHWSKVGAIAWTDHLQRRYLWDRKRNLLRCQWQDKQNRTSSAYLSLAPPNHGLVQRNHKPLQPLPLQKATLRNVRLWWQDARLWLNPLAEIFAPHTLRKRISRNGRSHLLLIHKTHHTASLFLLASTGIPTSWQRWSPSSPIGGLKVQLSAWKADASGIHLSHQRTMLWSTLRLEKLRTAKAVSQLAAKDPFAPLLQTPKAQRIVSLPPASQAPSPYFFDGLALAFLLLLGLSRIALQRFTRPRTHFVFPSPIEHPLRHAHIVEACMPRDFCQHIIQTAEAHPWTQERHTQPTLDQPIQNIPALHSRIVDFLEQEAFPKVAALYQLPADALAIREAFVVKYDASSQKLDLHRDASILTLSIALNDASEYTGGGTYFASLQRVLPLPHAGDMLIHCGKLQHGGWTVKSGTRYLLVCFIDCSAYPDFAHAEIQTWNSAEPNDTEVMRRIYSNHP